MSRTGVLVLVLVASATVAAVVVLTALRHHAATVVVALAAPATTAPRVVTAAPHSSGPPTATTIVPLVTTTTAPLLVSASPQSTPVATTSIPLVTTTTATPILTSTTVAVVRPLTRCAAAIAAVEAKGLYSAPGFPVTCPGPSYGHFGMTCPSYDPWYCPTGKRVVITLPDPYVVANEFSNSRCFAHLSECYGIDGGGRALGFKRPW